MKWFRRKPTIPVERVEGLIQAIDNGLSEVNPDDMSITDRARASELKWMREQLVTIVKEAA